MTDRELLELAAKAAGMEVQRFRLDDPIYGDVLIRGSSRNPHHNLGPWNPLTDDGDALRLAVKLHINITCAENFSGAKPFYGGKGFDFPAFDDPDEATRRAIVRAAAEIGKQMEEHT